MKQFKISNYLKNLRICLKDSSIHGLKYIVDEKSHWSERLLWIILCGFNWCAFTVTLFSICSDFAEKPTAITVDTSYLDWDSPFPTIAVCSSFNQAVKEKAESLIKKFSNGTMNSRVLSQQLFLPSRMGYLRQLEKLNISGEDYARMYDEAKPNCSKTFESCEWNEQPFECCSEFATLQTAVGFCQMLNSKHSISPNSSIQFGTNRTHKTAYLAFDFTEEHKKSNPDIQIYVLNNVELPTLATSDSKMLKNIEKVVGINFNVRDIVNEDGVRDTSPEKRECRFPEENHDTLIYDLYSYDGCTTDTEVRQMQKICGCVSYLYPRKPGLRTCNMTGMRCIGEYRRNAAAAGSVKGCAPDCEGAAVTWHTNQVDEFGDTQLLGVRVRMLSTPHMRYQRYVVRSLLDVIVSCGSSNGLFTGASVLSIVELLFIVLYRSVKLTRAS